MSSTCQVGSLPGQSPHHCLFVYRAHMRHVKKGGTEQGKKGAIPLWQDLSPKSLREECSELQVWS